jgi:hypothetical protein
MHGVNFEGRILDNIWFENHRCTVFSILELTAREDWIQFDKQLSHSYPVRIYFLTSIKLNSKYIKLQYYLWAGGKFMKWDTDCQH